MCFTFLPFESFLANDAMMMQDPLRSPETEPIAVFFEQ